MNIVNQKTGFKHKFLRFLMYKYKYLSDLFFKKNTYLNAKNSIHTTQISSFKYI